MVNEIKLINKVFEDKKVRIVWDKDEEKFYVSVVDIVSTLTDNEYQLARNYWKVLKNRLSKEGNETVTNCNQLKLKSQDGKNRLTDVVTIEGMFKIIESIPSKNAEPIKQWLAKLGSERIDEIFVPAQKNYESVGFVKVKERENIEIPFSGKYIDYEMVLKK